VDRWDRIDEIIDRIEGALVVLFLSSMISLAFLQIVLRNAFATGLAWGDPLVRNLVLWIGFIGAAIATREGKHINIDVLSRWLSPLGKMAVDVITQSFSFSICCLMTYAALKFIQNEVQMRHVTFLGLPAWVPELILPITFGLMAFRFGLRSLKNISMMATRRKGN
jgi:TRAP-type C4-dicarboxylate transport system permease small subunit